MLFIINYVFQGLTFFNKLGVCQSDGQKMELLRECAKETQTLMVKQVKRCPFCHIIGDNCDIRIKPNNQSSDHALKDCHWYVTLVTFSRIADQLRVMSNIPPQVDKNNIDLDRFLLSATEKTMLREGYKVEFGWLMAENMDCCKFLSFCPNISLIHFRTSPGRKLS